MYESSVSEPPVLDLATLPVNGEGMLPKDILAHFTDQLTGKILNMHYGPQREVVVQALKITGLEFPDDATTVIHAENEDGVGISRIIDEHVTEKVFNIYELNDFWFKEDNGIDEIWWGITNNPVAPLYVSRP